MVQIQTTSTLVPRSACTTRELLERAKGWYCSESQTSFNKVLEHAFAEGKQTYIDTLCNGDETKAWTSSQASINEILQAVITIRNGYDAKRTSKAWKWLTQISSRINHYGSILDVMVQHHPEYAALVWGVMKVLFVGIQNHEESVHQLSKALCRFANCLPRQELKLILYPSPQMQQAVAQLYANLIQFLVHTMHWYQKGRPRRALGAIFKPFALDFQDQLTEVNELSKSVDDIAVTAAQAELRAVHAKVEDAYSELTSVRMEIKRLGDLVSLEAARVFQVASCTQSLSSQIQLDLRSQASMISTVQINQIMSAPFMADVPSSGQSLHFCSNFARRQQQAVTLSKPEIETLRNWSIDLEVAYLIMETRDLAYSKTLLLSLLQQIRNTGRPIIWALRFEDYHDRTLCIQDIVRILVLHALEINSEGLVSQRYPVTLASLRAASTQEDWLSILDRALAGLEEVYIIVDPDILRFAAENNSCAAADIILALRRHITSARLKIIVSSFGINRSYFVEHLEVGTWKALRTNHEVRQRLAKTKRQHLARVSRMRRK